jgi:hypothetical protein
MLAIPTQGRVPGKPATAERSPRDPAPLGPGASPDRFPVISKQRVASYKDSSDAYERGPSAAPSRPAVAPPFDPGPARNRPHQQVIPQRSGLSSDKKPMKSPLFNAPTSPQSSASPQHRPDNSRITYATHTSSKRQTSDRAVAEPGAPKQTSASWIGLYEKLATAVKVRHYSPKTLEAYRSWIRKLQTFTRRARTRACSAWTT